MHISNRKRCFNVKSSTYYFPVKMKILTDFQICISVSLKQAKNLYFWKRQGIKYKEKCQEQRRTCKNFETKQWKFCGLYPLWFLFYQGFLSPTLTTYRTPGEGREPFLIPPYLFHPLTNIQTFIYNFVCELTITCS